MRRGIFIGRCLEVQEAFAFAPPTEILAAIKLYCGDLYGGMLADLGAEPAIQLANCWSTTIKDVWGVPRGTHRVLTRWLGQGHTTIREDLFSRWVKFFQLLLTGPSPEVAVVARVAAADMRTTTARNNKLILDNTGLDVRVATPKQVLEEMRLRETEMTSAESHTARLLTRALEQRGFLDLNDICTKDITDTIESLCTT